MTTLQTVELGVLGPLQVRQYGLPVAIPGVKPRAILTMLGLHGGSVVSADTFLELLWGEDPPRTAAKALQTHISSLRRTLGDGFVLTEGTGWTLSTTEVDATRYKLSARMGRDAVAAGDTSQAVARFDEALTLWRGTPELPDCPRGVSEKTRWIEGHAALVEDRADALLATGRAAEIIGDLEAAIADAPLRERRWGQLMLALYRAGRQGEALGAYQRARSLLADELGVDPGPDLRRLEAAIVAQDTALEMPVSQQLTVVTRAVTFLLTDIEGSTAAWESDADAMAVALARHDEVVEHVVTSRGGRLIKTRGEGDATFSVFERPSAAAAAAIELQEAIRNEPWALSESMRIRVALHTGEVELRDGDYFGRAVNRAARLRSLAAGGQILCSGATAELVIDSIPEDVILADLGMRQLRNLARPEHVFELRLETADDSQALTADTPMERPGLPAVLAGPGPFVGRGPELERLLSAWQTALGGGAHAVLIAGEPGVGKTRLAGEWSRHAYEQGAVVLYGRCDEDLGAPYQPFAEALRSLIPCLGASRLRGLRGIEALLSLVPGLTDVLPDLAAPTRADPDTERYALFDAVVAVLGVASTSAPVVLILDDLHWAAKPTLLLLRHLLRFGEHARVQIVGTYRSTDLDRSHPLAAMLADLHRDGSATRLQLSGLDEVDVSAYVAEAGYNDEELARALASVTGGNPFFLIEALRHVDESGGRWDPSTLPQGVREAVSRRLSRLPAETNKALAAAAVVGSRFALELVERVVGDDLIDAFDEACQAGIVIEEPGGRYRFNHAIVRQSLLAELASVRRMRLHQSIAATLETEPGADDELLADLAHHYFECAWAGNAAKAVDYCRRAADQAMARLAYEGAADLYDRAVHALEEIDEELPDRDDQKAELLVARCEALLAAGDVVSAAGAVSQLQAATHDSPRLAAWGTCFDGQLSMLTDPERLDEIESALAAAAEELAGLDDAAGEAKAHTVRAGCLARLGRIADAETALDHALTAARRAREHRRVNAVLANAPLAALWGPNPVPRAGGRCLDVVRLLRITTGSPVVEATSTRCQAVLDALRGRAAAGRSLLDSARRTLTELGMRHALLEVDQFAGILELVADDPAAAEPHLRRAYNGFRRMGLDADTAETAALLARACLALDRDAEADELCTESERLAGHALKASIAWRTARAQLLARGGAHDEARRVADEAVEVAERTDLLVDHGDACLALATVLGIAGDTAAARAAADKAVGLYELKGAAALAEKARSILGERSIPPASTASEAPIVEPDNACVELIRHLDDALDREAWDEVEQQFATEISAEDRRKIVGFSRRVLSPTEWARPIRHVWEMGPVRHHRVTLAVRGERLSLSRFEIGTADTSPGAPQAELLHLFGLDTEGRIALHVAFDVEDIDAATAELDAAHARFEEQGPHAPRLENTANRVLERYFAHFAAREWDSMAETLADDFMTDDRRRVVNAGIRHGRAAEIANLQAFAEVGTLNITLTIVATRGERLVLVRDYLSVRDWSESESSHDGISVVEINADNQISAHVLFDPDDIDAAFAELDARYVAGEAAVHARTWSAIAGTFATLDRHESPSTTPDFVETDHRRGSAAPGEVSAFVRASWDLMPDMHYRIAAVNRLNNHGGVVTHVSKGTSQEGFEAEWRVTSVVMVKGDLLTLCEIFDERDLDAAITRFEHLSRPTQRLENAASRLTERLNVHFAARDWDAMTETMAEDLFDDDRRRVVGAGVRHGRDAVIANVRAVADVGCTDITSTVIATRGAGLVLSRDHFSIRDQRSEAFHAEVLGIIEIDANERIVARFAFDPDDIDAAIEELDSRYLAGEAAPYSRIWQFVMNGLGALNRHEPGLMTREVAYADHRRLPFAAGDFGRAVEDLWALVPDARYRVTAVHALDAHGVVGSLVIEGTDLHGNELQWARICLISFASGQARMDVYEEDDLDAALARFEELRQPARRLENAASQVAERFWAHFTARDWDAMAEILADDISTDDRRRVVNAGLRRGRDAEIAGMRATAEVTESGTLSVIAIRGERLALSRLHLSGRDQRPEAFHTEALGIVEIDADNRIAAHIAFDPDDIEAAFEELETRYLAGEAAAHSHSWSVIARSVAGINRHELPATTPDWINIDHRRVTSFAAGDLFAFLRASWDQIPDIKFRVETVHRLSDLGAVVTQAVRGTSQEGFEAEWRYINVARVEGDLINDSELFDETDIDAALARFDELSLPAPQLENAASRAYDRFNAYLAARDWDAMAEMITDDICNDDRRRVVSGGVQRGRDAQTANLRAVVDVGVKNFESVVIATRGERLALSRTRVSGGQRPEAFGLELLTIIEIDTDNRIAAGIQFDIDDLDAAFEELETRYFAGEAAAHAQTWSVIAGARAALVRRELPPTTPDWVNLDHRRGIAFAPGDTTAYFRALWDAERDFSTYIEAVHRLNDVGTVFTQVARGTTHEGFDAEWRVVEFMTVDGDLVSRAEFFDEADIDAAFARFEELSRPAPRLENAASQMNDRFLACFAARDWDAMAALMVDDSSIDDRRRVVNAGLRRGRDAEIASMRAIADLGVQEATSAVIATRGERLALSHDRFLEPEGFLTEVLGVLEINADERIGAVVVFDVDDMDAAFEELDARYLAGEAAAHAHTWSVIAGAVAAANRHEFPALTPDWVNVDHRRAIAFAPGDMTAYVEAIWDTTPHTTTYVEAVHRLSAAGAVVTQAARGTSQQGFEAEWRMIGLTTVEGDLVNRCELFDETDLDAALAKFDELNQPTRQLENVASKVYQRFLRCFAARDWVALTELLADDSSTDDRRRVVNAGVQHGREAQIADMRSLAEIGANISATVMATRGERLTLTRVRSTHTDLQHGEFDAEMLVIIETDADNRIAAGFIFDLDDVDAALEELDARYLAGEAVAHAHTWSVIANAYVTVNRRELPPTTPDWVNVDHRGGATAFAPGDQIAYMRASFEQSPDINMRNEAVHRLSDLGAVVTNTVHGTSQEGFEAEWREIALITVAGDQFNRCELFDEAHLDAALAKFDELSAAAPQLENAASRVDDRFEVYFAARDWDAMAELMADDISIDDRRRVVNAGLRRGRDVEIANMRAIADLGTRNATSAVIATRGERLALSRNRFVGRDLRPEAFHTEALVIIEIGADERIVARVAFDPDDIDAAFEELDARYLAGEAADHSRTWSAVARAYEAFNRHDVPPTTPDWVYVDNRRLLAFETGDPTGYAGAVWHDTPDIKSFVESVQRLTDLGAVITHETYGTSEEGFDAEWRMVAVMTVDGDLFTRYELFDETDLDAALAKFDELSRPSRQLENAASRAFERFQTYFAARDWTAMAEILAEDMCNDDRRRVVGAGVLHGRDTDVAHMRAIADVGAKTITSTVIATRGERLVLRRVLFSGEDQGPETFEAELLGIVEIDADERIVARLSFDADDVAAAFEELDTRYLAGDSAAHAHTWSVIAGTYAAFNRHGLVPDWVSVDHRRGSPFASSDLNATIRASRDLTPNLTIHIETVHQLSAFGAVVTNMSFGTSDAGFAAEWRMVQLLTVDGDRITRLEIFDEDDIDAALAGFDELSRRAPQLENAASQLLSRFLARFAARNWNAMAELLTDDTSTDDRRPLVGVGPRCGRDTVIADWRATADVGVKNVTFVVVATRGERLALARLRFMGRDERPEAFRTDVLGVIEIDTDQRIPACVMLDVDDVDAAFEELDARYLAGEAAAHAHTWSVIASVYAAFNRHELPARTADWVSIDHRPLVAIEASDLAASIRAVWDLTPELRIHIEAVHRLTHLGAIITHAAHGVTPEGFDAEWRMVFIYTVDGDLINRYELFDEADIDSAIARFDELDRPAPQLENAASRVAERFSAYMSAPDWTAMAEMVAEDMSNDDRRPVVNAGLRRGRDAEIANVRALVDLGVKNTSPVVIATRGDRLALGRIRLSGRDQRPEAFHTEVLGLIEVDADDRIAARVWFELDDIDAAFEELESRYLAGEAAAHAHTWSVIAKGYAALNRRELPATTPNWVTVDHRHGTGFEPGGFFAFVRAAWDVAPDMRRTIEAVYRLSTLGAVFTHTGYGTSRQGFDAEWRTVVLVMVEGDLISSCELFDEADIDVALARFDELDRPAPQLENAATRARTRTTDAFNRRDVDGFLSQMNPDGRYEDRRKGLRDDAAGQGLKKVVRALFEAPKRWRLETEPVAIRGSRLGLTRDRYRDTKEADRPITGEHLTLTEVGDDNLVHRTVLFDPDDINGAMAELTARWIVSGEVAHPEVIGSVQRINEIVSRHEWDAIAKHFAGASYVNHRQLAQAGTGTIADWLSSMRTIESLVPDFWVELAEVLTRSAIGIVGRMTLKGTSTEGSAIEIPYVLLILFDSGRVTRFEAFDEDQRDLAMARFDEVSRPA